MNYQRFSQLWDQLVTKPLANRVEDPARPLLPCSGMGSHTSEAFIAYGRGDRRLIDASRARLRAFKLREGQAIGG